MKLLLRVGHFQRLPRGITIIRAVEEDRMRAFHLVRSVFAERGYINTDRSGMELDLWNKLAFGATYVAKKRDSVIGVQSLLPDTAKGLPCDRAFGGELDQLRAEGRTLAEAANEVVLKEKGHGAVASNLFRRIFAHAVTTGVTDIVTAVSPIHVTFYEFMWFDAISEARSFTTKILDPVIVVKLDVTKTVEKLRRTQDGQGDDTIFRDFYLTENPYMTMGVAGRRTHAGRR